MLKLLAKYIVVVILGGSLAGVGANSGIARNLENRLNQLQLSVQQTSTAEPTGTPAPTATVTVGQSEQTPTVAPSATPSVTLTPTATATPVVTQCASNGEDVDNDENSNSVEERHESRVAQQHERERSNEKGLDEKCEAAGREVEKSPESSEGAPVNNEGTQVQNQNAVRNVRPIVIFVQAGSKLESEILNFLKSLQLGSGQ